MATYPTLVLVSWLLSWVGWSTRWARWRPISLWCRPGDLAHIPQHLHQVCPSGQNTKPHIKHTTKKVLTMLWSDAHFSLKASTFRSEIYLDPLSAWRVGKLEATYQKIQSFSQGEVRSIYWEREKCEKSSKFGSGIFSCMQQYGFGKRAGGFQQCNYNTPPLLPDQR